MYSHRHVLRAVAHDFTLRGNYVCPVALVITKHNYEGFVFPINAAFCEFIYDVAYTMSGGKSDNDLQSNLESQENKHVNY